MDSKENPDSGLELELPAAKKICLDNNDVSNTFRNNSSLSDSTLHLGDLFSPRQSLSSCSINDKDDTSIVSSPLQRNQTYFENNKCPNEDENKVFIFSSAIIDDKSGCSTALTDKSKAPECVTIIENDNKNCSLLSEFKSSLSQKAFNIEESLDFMDETGFESHSENDSNLNIVTDVMDSPEILNKSDIKKNENISVHDENSISDDSINLTNKSDTNCSNKLDVTLDYTCKPDVTGEEIMVSCHSTIKKGAMLPNYKLFSDPSSTAMSIDESLVSNINNIPCQPKEEASSDFLKKASIGCINFEDSDCEKQCDNSNSTNLFNEVSGCALDYTCSKSVELDVDGTFSEISLTNKANKTNISVILECSHREQEVVKTPDSVITKLEDLVTESNMKMEHKNFLNLNENNVPNVEHPVNDLYDLSDLKNSFMSNKTFSADEVNFLKENLLKVMELLKNDNNSFESYKLASECEKRELVEKIKHLESNSTKNFGYCENILVSGKTFLEGNTGHSVSNNIFSEELSKSREQYNNLLQLVLVSESNWMENKLFVDFLSHLNIAHKELFIPITEEGKEYVINHKKIYDLMLTFAKEVFKTHSFKEECNLIVKTFLESCNMDTYKLHFIPKELDPNLVENLKVTFEEIINLKNALEKENAELKKEVCNKSDEIKMLTLTIGNLNQQLNIFKETADTSSNKIFEDKCSNVTETIQNLSLKITEKIFHDDLDESVTDMKGSCSISENTLSPSQNNYSNISSKCENVSQKMCEVEQVYQELLLHHNVLKTEFDSKCCEIEKLNSENQILIEKIDYLKSQCNIKDNKNNKTEPSSSGQHESSYNETVCINKSRQDLSFKSVENALLFNSEDKSGLEMSQNNLSIKENLVELQRNLDCLEPHGSSSENEVLKLQLDLNCMNEQYSEVLSKFDFYKQNYTHTEDEYNSWKEEKQSLQCALDSLKHQLETALEESSKLKPNDEIQNEIEYLLAKLSDLETTNANLKTQMSGLHSASDQNIDSLNKEMSELKIKLDSAEKLLMDYENQHIELKASNKKIWEDLESKNADLLLITDSKEKLEQELEISIQNDEFLRQRIEELLENRNSLEAQFLSSKDEVSQLQVDLDCLNEKYSEVLNNFDLRKKTHVYTEDEYTSLKEEKQSLESALDSLQSQLETALEDSSKLKYNNGEINNYLKNIEDELCDEKLIRRDVQNSYENLKIKYVELFVKINLKTKEIQNLTAQLHDLETINANLKNELNRLHDDSEKNLDLLNKEAFGLRKKCEISEKSLIDLQEKQNEITLSYRQSCVDLESKKSEILLLSNSKEQLEKEIDLLNQNEILLRQKIVELEKDRNNSELQFHSSNDQVSKLQLDFNGLDEKYSEMLSEFDLYKKTHMFTEDEYNLLKEEKHLLECALDSLKSQVESAHEESSKLKSDNEEINHNLKKVENQLYNEIENRKDIANTLENLKTKYEQSVIEINNKTTELNNLLVQLSDLETSNASLKTELTNFCKNAGINSDLLNNEICELKVKCDSTEKLLMDQEKKYSELKISYDKICEDLKSKSTELSSVSDSEEKLKKELEIFCQNDILLKQRIEELQENRNCLETQFLLSKEEVSKLQLDFNGLEEKYSEILTEFDLYKKTYIITEDECNLWKEEKQSLKSELDSIKSQLENALEESSKLKFDNEEISKNVKNIEDQLNNEKQYSRDIQNCNDDLKTKYEELIVEIDNKTIELKNLLAKLADLETVNGNLKDELNRLHSDSENNIGLINEEVLELKSKCEASENLLIDHKQKYEELKVSYEKMSEDLESKNAELSLLTACKEKLENELELLNRDHTLLKQKIIELQEDRECLEVRFHSSKAEVSNLQSELDCLKEKNSKMVSDFSIYKEQFTHTKDECILLNEEKQLLKSESDSLKSKLECVHEELKKLKFDYAESNKNLNNVESQLCDEKKNCRDIQNLFDNLKIKYEESVSVIDSKASEIQNLLGQLTDLESINMNLKSELNVIRRDSEHNIELLNQKVLELKDKYENSEKLRVDLEQKHDELKVSYNKSCEDFELKHMEFSLLTDCKEQLEKEIDTLSQNNLSLKEKLKDLEINAEGYRKTLSDLNIQLDSANSKIDLMKTIEMKVSALNNHDVLSSYRTKDMETGGNQPFSLFSEFVNTVEAVIKDLILFKEKCSDEETKLSCCQEEVSRLNILLDSLKEELKLSTEECSKLQESYSTLSKQYSSLLDTNKDSNIRCNSLLEKLKDLESQKSFCKSEIQNLKSEMTTKDSIIADLSSVKELYESTVKENEALSSQLMQKIKEHETALGEVKSFEQKYLSLKLEFNTLTNEINDLRSKNETLATKCNENYTLYIQCKDNMEILLKEKEEIRKNFIKCEKENQNSLDLVKKFQENMGNLDKQYNLSIAKLNEILKEKESYESQNLSLQKTNDELLKRNKELNLKIQENQNILMKFKELEKSHETLRCKHECMEKEFIDCGNLKKENEILKSRVSVKESLYNNLSINYNTLNEKYNMLSGELKTLSSAVKTLVPEENSVIEIINVVGEKLKAVNKMEKDLEEERMKCENLDEECNILNEDLKYKDVVIGDMYKDHSSQMNELKDLLKKEENLRQEILLENSTLKDKIKCLDSEITKLKTTEPSPCSSCAELKGVLQKLKMDLVDNSSKVTTLQLEIQENENTHKKKIHDYRKKISTLQEELGAALNKLEDNRLKNEVACLDASIQTESLPVQMSGQSGIVQSFKIKEQEDKIKKIEKENLVLKRMCQSRLQTIQELKSNLENVSKPQKTQRNALEEVQNHQSS